MDGSDAAPPEGTLSLRGVLLNRNFFPYFLGSLISNSGTWFQSIAQVLFTYRLTGSLFMVGVINFAQFAGILLLTPIGGSIADHFDRRRLLIASQLIAALLTGTLAALTAADLVTMPVLFTLVLLAGFAIALTTPTMHALISSLVTREELATAIALNGATYQAARILGPVLGALVVDRLGFAWAFTVNSLSFLTMAVAVAFVHSMTPGRARGGRLPRVWEGFRVVRRDAELASVLLVGAAVSLAMDPITTLGPAFATRAFGRADTLVGVLIGVYGAGAILAAFTRNWREGPASTVRLAGSLTTMVVGMLGFAFAPSLAIALPVLAVAGFGYLSSTAASTARVQLSISDELRGRVMALWTLGFLGVRPLASLLDGSIASFVGIRVSAALMTVPGIAVAIALFRLRHREGVGRIDRP